MKKLFLVLLLGGLGYWIGTGDAATEWKAFQFWSENREALPMLEARANWVLEEFDASLPEIAAAPTNAEEMSALAEELAKGTGVASTSPGGPSYHRAKIAEHRDRSAAFGAYTKIREAARADDFRSVEKEHLSILGQSLDAEHVITVWQELATVRTTLPSALHREIREALIWRTTVNLSTRERVASAPFIIQVPLEGDVAGFKLGSGEGPPAASTGDGK